MEVRKMKLNKILVLALLCFQNVEIEEKGESISNSSKIIFEDCDNTFLSLNSDCFSKKDYSLMIKLNYDELIPKNFNNEVEKNNEYNRLKDYYSKMNKKMYDEIRLDKYENVYLSKYSNYISIDANNETINDTLFSLASEERIEKIFVSEQAKNVENLTNATNYIDVTNYINVYNHDASGVVVGILEPGILDKSNSNFNGCNVTVRDEWYFVETIKQHTTMMGSIIGGVNGIARNCKLLSVQLSGNAVSEIDWLLDNNVNVINCSYGDENPTGKYSSKSAYMDFITYNYKVTFVISAGNTGNSDTYVANPGLSYNAITVGACSSSSGYSRNFSSYSTLQGPRKPNIVAPGYNLSIPSFSSLQSGTSFSAAITTGCVALLMKHDVYLKYYPQRVLSILMASAINPDSLYFGSNLDEHVGAGVLNYQDAYAAINNSQLLGFSDSIYDYSIPIDLVAGDNIRAVISSLAYSDGSVSSTNFTNYNLYLYDSNNNIVESQTTTEDTVELLEVNITNSGSYYLKIEKTNPVCYGTQEKVSLTYKIY